MEEQTRLGLYLVRFLSPIPSSLFLWQDRTIGHLVKRLAEQEHPDEMPILADALLDAGCEDERLLTLVRSRARWVLRYLLLCVESLEPGFMYLDALPEA